MAIDKLHFANFFGVFANPQTDLIPGEMAFNANMRLVYKDTSNVLHLLPSIDDYTNIYNPATIQVTQTVKDATIGVGTEGNFSAKVAVAIPHSFVITATDIHERQVLIQYNQSNAIKDILVLPEFFCKLNTDADVFDVNQGIMIEAISKTKILSNLGREVLTNNAVFKLMKLETGTFASTLGYPSVPYADRDLVANRDKFCILNNEVFLIKNKTVTELTYPFWIFNKRATPVTVRLPTQYFLFEKNDKFSMKTYRSFSDNAVASTHEFVSSSETAAITSILKSAKVTPVRISNENLTISANGKSVEGLDSQSYYDIVVTTNEVKPHPTLVYKMLDITDGFLAYLYRVMKYISNNSNGMGGTLMGGTSGKKYLFEYTYSATANGITSFAIPEEFFSPATGDKEMLSYKGINLEDVDYSIAPGTRVVTLNFPLTIGDEVHAFIFKYADRGGEASLISSLQNYINTVNTDLQNTKIALNVALTELPKTNLLPDSGRFMGSGFHPLSSLPNTAFSAGMLFSSYNGSVLTDGGMFTYDSSTYGGAGAALPQTVADLLESMPNRKLSTGYKRYGAHFRVLQIVAGAGTNSPYSSKYMMTTNNSLSISGSQGYSTIAMWIKLQSGSPAIIRKGGLAGEKLRLNGVEQSTDITLTTAQGWVHVEMLLIIIRGYEISIPFIYGTSGTTLHIALPVIMNGKYGVGIHETPIMTFNASSS